ncbi:MFS transporter [Actinomadura barringtoniae]|uniref:MFS transporter n=1 Tax=Actinomadura barringtoniae TaxID=1427535 RepID=A0A939T9Z0_9ACTN|nr:MFS transporter [Actinomadura barringtoniae]MBO2448495.1 MFS transporter [Actinomadura barringtoniae]
MGRRLTLLLALTCGVSVSTIYFPQAITPLIATGLHVSPATAALVATTAQLGYAAGVFFLVPLGDRLPHRPLIITLLALTGLGLIAAGAAPNIPVLVTAGAFIGVVTVVPQVILPMAAGLVSDDRRGAVTGTLLSGLIGGILLARTFGGTVGAWLGWRAPYLIAAALLLLLAATLTASIPATAPQTREPYRSLLTASLRLLRTEPELRRSALYQATLFGGFSAAWTSLALLVTGPAYDRGPQTVGLIALVGAASMFCTPIAGRWIDRRGPDVVNLTCTIGVMAAAALLLPGTIGGIPGLVILGAGMLLLDVAVQSSQVANQSRIFALNPKARSRLNTAYMTCSFLGGSAGSWLGVRAYTTFGWHGVCALVAVAAAIALIRHLLHRSPMKETHDVPSHAAVR